jgi:hypothetical protein
MIGHYNPRRRENNVFLVELDLFGVLRYNKLFAIQRIYLAGIGGSYEKSIDYRVDGFIDPYGICAICIG